MPPRNAVPIINTPEHHYGAMILTLLTRAPDDATLKAAVHLADNAAIAAWALRPDALVTLTVEQYRQPRLRRRPPCPRPALYLGGNRKRIRTLADHIAREITELLTHYAPPKTQN